MSNYVLQIDEQSKKGKLVLQLLDELTEKSKVKILPFEVFEKKSDEILMKEIKKGLRTATLSYEEGKKEFLRIRKAMKK